MHLRRTLASLAILACFGGIAQAKIISGGPVYAGPSSAGGQITCRLFNAGTGLATVTSRQIFTNTNVPIALTSDGCGAGLGPSQYCAFTGFISGNFAFSCRANVVGTGSIVKGSVEAATPGFGSIQALPVQ